MKQQVPLPTGSYVTRDPRASCRRLVNCFSEIMGQTTPADSKATQPPITMRRAAGIPTFADTGLRGTSNAVRGFREMAGVQYVVTDSSLYSVSSTGALTLLGSGITGTGFVRMCDNTACLFILIPGTNVGYTYTVANGFALFTNATFLTYGAIDVWFVDSFMVFLALGGRTFYNDDGQAVSGTGPITFVSAAVFPREFGTDLFVGGTVDHREVLLFGTRTTEGFLNAGNPTNSPFASAPESFMEIGCHPQGAYAIAIQDQATFFVANDKTVRRRNGQTPQRVSNSGIESILEIANLTGCYALTPSIGGHPLWVLVMPVEGRTIAYDCLTTEWFELVSFGFSYWRPLCWYNGFGRQLVGDSQGGQIGYLDLTTFTEFGNPQTLSFTTQAVTSMNMRIVHRRLEIVITSGKGTSLTIAPLLTCYKSDDGGQTWIALPMRKMGVEGNYIARTHWENLGQARNRVYRFQLSDITTAFTVQINADLDGGEW